MSALLEELVRENVRTLGAAISRRGSASVDAQDAEDAISMALRYYEDVRVLWDRHIDLLAVGLDARRANEGFQTAVAMFDEWLAGARRVEELIESVSLRTGRTLGSADTFRKVIERVVAVRLSASEPLELVASLPLAVDPAAIAQARIMFDQGKYKDLGDVLSRRTAGIP